MSQDFLSNRKQPVGIGSYISSATTDASGVLQGSVLGALGLLFSVFINDVCMVDEIHNVGYQLCCLHTISSFRVL